MRTIVSLIIICLLAGCGSDAEKPRSAQQVETTSPPSPAEVNRGELIFEKQCRRCHALNGSGGNRGVDLSRAGLRYTPLALRTLIAHSTTPDMQSIRKLPEEDKTAVILYLSTLR